MALRFTSTTSRFSIPPISLSEYTVFVEYIGADIGTRRPLVTNYERGRAVLSINEDGELGFDTRDAFHSTGFVVEDNTRYIFGVASGGAETEIWADGILLETFDAFVNCTTSQINNIGGGLYGGLAPSSTLAPSQTLAPSSPVAASCNGDIYRVWIFDYRLTHSEIRGYYAMSTPEQKYTKADWHVDNMSSDNVIDVTEKQTIVDWWNAINGNGQNTGTYWTNRASLVAASASTTNLDNAFVALRNYLIANTIFSMSEPYYQPTVILSPSTIVASEWKAIWEGYYSAESESTQLVSDALASQAQSNSESYADGLALDLQDQIDGKITCFYQSTEPTSTPEYTLAAGDLWFDTDDGNNQYRYNGTIWQDVHDTAIDDAYDLADDANILAGTKNTVWSTLALANSGGAVIGDIFVDSNLMYRATVSAPSITTANSTRLTPKRYPDVANTTARNALTGMIANDTVYQTDTNQWYYYSGGWVVDGDVVITQIDVDNRVPVVAPKYLGIGQLSSLSSATFTGATVDGDGVVTTGSSVVANKEDWMVNYLDNATFDLSVYVWSGTAWAKSAITRYIDSCQTDIFNLGTGGYAIDGLTIIQNAMIKNLMTQNLKLLEGGKIYTGAGNFDSGDTDYYQDYTGNFSLGSLFVVDKYDGGPLGEGILLGNVLDISGDIVLNRGTGYRIQNASRSNNDLPIPGVVLASGCSGLVIYSYSTDCALFFLGSDGIKTYLYSSSAAVTTQINTDITWTGTLWRLNCPAFQSRSYQIIEKQPKQYNVS